MSRQRCTELLCSVLKKPIIILAYALCFIAFLSFYDAIYAANNNAVADLFEALTIFYVTWGLSFIAFLRYFTTVLFQTLKFRNNPN